MSTTTIATPSDDKVFDHPGLLYRDRDEYLHGTTTFVRSAVAAGDAILIAVPEPNLALLRDALADLASTVRFADMTVAGRNPGRIIPGVLLAFAAENAGRRVSIIGEPIWPGRSSVEYPACAAHEALINAVFAGRDAAILCPYDATGLAPEQVRDAWRTHPVMIKKGRQEKSPSYEDPLVTAAAFDQPLPTVPATASTMPYGSPRSLAGVRRLIRDHATAAGLSADRVEDLVVAVNELTENTIKHTAAGGTVAIWTEQHQVACQIDDQGRLTNPLAGRVPPGPRTEGGRGLLLANLLCDLVRIHSGSTGTTIRLHMGLLTG